MISINKKESCSGCHACYSVCPKKCIEMERDEEGFLYPFVDLSKCINCGLCESICPIINKNDKENQNTVCYAVKYNNEKIRKESSSGGVFTAIASAIIKNDGVVFGAAYDENFMVEHISVNSEEELKCLRGSKYMQSVINDNYKKVEEALLSNKPVLFSGTPCQIAGLKAYLKKDYDNLYTQDVICHGVTSPKMWGMYVRRLENKYKSKIVKVNFRDKEKAWKKYNVTFMFEDGQVISQPFFENVYMKAFLKNLILRPSCYECSFKGIDRQSDITLADFWGIENVLPEFDDDKGVSLVVLHTKKGQDIFNNISNNLMFEKVEIETAIKENPSAITSSHKHGMRDKFFKRATCENFDKLTEKYVSQSYAKKLINKTKRLIKKLLKK